MGVPRIHRATTISRNRLLIHFHTSRPQCSKKLDLDGNLTWKSDKTCSYEWWNIKELTPQSAVSSTIPAAVLWRFKYHYYNRILFFWHILSFFKRHYTEPRIIHKFLTRTNPPFSISYTLELDPFHGHLQIASKFLERDWWVLR